MKTSRCFAVLALIFSVVSPGQSQTYPRWFLFQGDVGCDRIAVGYDLPSFYRDSSLVRAFRLGCEMYAVCKRSVLTGTQVHHSLEIGSLNIGSDYDEEIDEKTRIEAEVNFRSLDSFDNTSVVIVLAGDSNCVIGNDQRITVSVASVPRPVWIEATPSDGKYYYGVGMVAEYFQEAKSWIKAEQHSRLVLARAISSKVILQTRKQAAEGESLMREDLSVPLHDIQIIERWRDVKNKIFYVLARMPKNIVTK